MYVRKNKCQQTADNSARASRDMHVPSRRISSISHPHPHPSPTLDPLPSRRIASCCERNKSSPSQSQPPQEVTPHRLQRTPAYARPILVKCERMIASPTEKKRNEKWADDDEKAGSSAQRARERERTVEETRTVDDDRLRRLDVLRSRRASSRAQAQLTGVDERFGGGCRGQGRSRGPREVGKQARKEGKA